MTLPIYIHATKEVLTHEAGDVEFIVIAFHRGSTVGCLSFASNGTHPTLRVSEPLSAPQLESLAQEVLFAWRVIGRPVGSSDHEE